MDSRDDVTPKVIKKQATLLDDYYATPNTSTLTFLFDSQHCPSIEARLRKSQIQHASINGKDLYLIDRFFQPEEGEGMRAFSEGATFSRNSYGSPEAIEQGEKPARSMNGKERWQFFARPPKAIQELYKLFSQLGDKLDAEVTTLPWELSDKASHGSPAVIANRLEEATETSRELGKHQDCNPSGRISFGVPVLYAPELRFHPAQFVNGEEGKPWLISAMLYTTAPRFLPQYQLGTVFYDDQHNLVLRSNCHNMRIVLFAGDILHSIEESLIPPGEDLWRISYVFKLIVNPKRAGHDLKTSLANYLKSLTPIEQMTLGPLARG